MYIYYRIMLDMCYYITLLWLCDCYSESSKNQTGGTNHTIRSPALCSQDTGRVCCTPCTFTFPVAKHRPSELFKCCGSTLWAAQHSCPSSGMEDRTGKKVEWKGKKMKWENKTKQKTKWCAIPLLTACWLPSQSLSRGSPNQSPQCCSAQRVVMVWSISLGSLGQRSWLVPLPSSLHLAGRAVGEAKTLT